MTQNSFYSDRASKELEYLASRAEWVLMNMDLPSLKTKEMKATCLKFNNISSMLKSAIDS